MVERDLWLEFWGGGGNEGVAKSVVVCSKACLTYPSYRQGRLPP